MLRSHLVIGAPVEVKLLHDIGLSSQWTTGDSQCSFALLFRCKLNYKKIAKVVVVVIMASVLSSFPTGVAIVLQSAPQAGRVPGAEPEWCQLSPGGQGGVNVDGTLVVAPAARLKVRPELNPCNKKLITKHIFKA